MYSACFDIHGLLIRVLYSTLVVLSMIFSSSTASLCQQLVKLAYVLYVVENGLLLVRQKCDQKVVHRFTLQQLYNTAYVDSYFQLCS